MLSKKGENLEESSFVRISLTQLVGPRNFGTGDSCDEPVRNIWKRPYGWSMPTDGIRSDSKESTHDSESSSRSVSSSTCAAHGTQQMRSAWMKAENSAWKQRWLATDADCLGEGEGQYVEETLVGAMVDDRMQ